ncbi:MAG: hypothetical protein M1827_006097 [Pycnora praestabilis]|nr:MAG: hypothetical protein M1827_006097 [Pycnora praestabilis]
MPLSSHAADPLRKRQKLSHSPQPEVEHTTSIQDSAMDEPNLSPTTLNMEDPQHQKEAEVGIIEFVSPDLPGFSGILKKRYTDFLVNEILPSGQVVHLDSIKAPKRKNLAVASNQTESLRAVSIDHTNGGESSAPEIPQQKPPIDNVNGDGDAGKPDVAEKAFKLPSEDETLLASYFESETMENILALYQKVITSPTGKPKTFGTVKSAKITDRALRTDIHQAMRRIFSSRLETSTDGEGAMIISAASSSGHYGSKPNTKREARPQIKGKSGWQDLGGDHLHFSLYKENKDTMEVIAFLARQLKLPPKSFQFAGTKDRRGVTVQRVSVYHIHADRLAGINRSLRGSKVGGFQYQEHGLELGELLGNEFVITLRDCSFLNPEGLESDDYVTLARNTISKAMSELSSRGFINYYGLQRFGTFSTRTDTIGVKMLQGDFKGACEAILDYSDESLAAAQDPISSLSSDSMISSDDKARAKALHSFKTTGKAMPALDTLPRKFSAESNIIKHLSHSERTNDYQGALQIIPRNLRLMYVHAYQSLVWNVIAGERWRRWGDKVVAGDLVLVSADKAKFDENIEVEDVDEAGEVVVKPGANDRTATAEDMFQRARALTEEEAGSGVYSIFDIVLPLPGYDVEYPGNGLADEFKSFMASERGGGLDPYDMRRNWKDVSLSGSYRKLIGRVGPGWSSEVVSYSREDEQWAQTDLEVLQKKSKGDTNGQKSRLIIGESTDSDEVPNKIAVILKLRLGSSQYATMALRELMKQGGVKTYKPDFGGGR